MFRSQKSSLITMLCFALATLLLFQNCDVTGDLTAANKSSASGSGNGGGGGQPYDGKPFVVRGSCDDGTLVRSRLVPIDGKYILYRENCETIAPRLVDASMALDSVYFGNERFTPEMPAIPLPGVVSWYVQLQGALQDRQPSIYIVDLFDTDALEIARLRGEGHTVVCRISAGTREDWNPDAAQFPAETVGRSVSGGGGERWVDIRARAVHDIMISRLDETKRRGCHGIDFDSVDGFVNTTGFPITRVDQMEYNQSLAFAAHDRDLIMSLNNVPELAPYMSTIFDFAIAEECFTYDECDAYRSFIDAKKPVLVIEYGAVSARECEAAKSGLLSLSYLNRALDGTRYDVCQ